MAENKDISNENEKVEINSTNIFEEFENDQKMASEVEEIKNKEERDKYYYMLLVSRYIQKFLLFGVFVLFFIFIYIFIQTDSSFNKKSYLKPICYIFTGNIEDKSNTCSSISYVKNDLINKIEDKKENYSNQILDIIVDIFKSKQFVKSKEVSFIYYKSKNKLRLTELLTEFNNLKVGYDGLAKDRIKCNDFSIDSSNRIFSANCYAYTKGYESKTIIGVSGDKNNIKQSGTSISLANSFLNYIEKKSTYFRLIERQKVFTKDNVSGEVVGFTNQTNFKLKLKF